MSEAWAHLEPGYRAIVAKYTKIDRGATIEHLGTLGTGNHFIEVCLDERFSSRMRCAGISETSA